MHTEPLSAQRLRHRAHLGKVQYSQQRPAGSKGNEARLGLAAPRLGCFLLHLCVRTASSPVQKARESP